jgi:hypothetical protein
MDFGADFGQKHADRRSKHVLLPKVSDQAQGQRPGPRSVGHRVARRLRFGGRDEGDQDILRVNDQVAHQVAHEPAGAAGLPGEVLVRECGDCRAQRRPGTGEEVHARTLL